MMNEKSELCLEERSKLLQELKGKYMFYADLIKRNRLDMEHHKYCNQSNHNLCGAIWGHSDIIREIISRIWWWFTGKKSSVVNVSTRPKLQSILEQIKKQRKQEYWQENEIEDEEYSWLMHIIDRCSNVLNSKKVQRAKDKYGKRVLIGGNKNERQKEN